MYSNSNKMFFYFILFFSTLISISSNSWFGCWIGLEINLLSFIPLISNLNNLFSSETSLKYFLIQSIASINFLFIILIKMTLLKNFEMNNFMSIMINFPLLMKMGAAPFHFWFPNLVEGLNWLNNFILMTWQKITPMILLSYNININFITIITIMNVMIGAIGGLNQTSLRKLMAFSSINNLGWMLISIMISENLWIFYLMFYSILISIMCFMFHIFNMFYLNQLFILKMNIFNKITIMINLLSLGGLPPFLGFLPKWITLNFLISNNFLMLTFIFVMMSLITLFFYIRISYSTLMFYYIKLKWMKIYFKNNIIYLNVISMISIMGLILSTFWFI
uniref:NADH-ubiquinone oxidoreductase chain 2 n=1 Tax=Rhodoneura mellea TaxID=1529670 RepID=A0A076EBB0_9NEOP|nr:NADH dehydrogenase subunit 2 [Rhodoneura mellea]